MVLVEEMMVASFGIVPAPKSKSTRSGVRKFLPLMVTTSPPCGRPVVGLIDVMAGVESGGCGCVGSALKVTVVVFFTFETVAETVAGPTVAEVSVTVAMPLVVVRMSVCAFPSVNVPRFVVNSTAVPLGTG